MALAALCFDFDGTLIDTETPIFEVWRELYADHGQELRVEAWAQQLGTDQSFDPGERLAGLSAAAVTAAELWERARTEIRRRVAQLPLRPGVPEVLAEARVLGLQLALVSSSREAWITRWLDHHNLQATFDVHCWREHVERAKPAPDLFLLAAERLGLAPADCLAIEDSANGVRAAQGAGMPCVLVPNALTVQLPLPEDVPRLGSLLELRLAGWRG